MARKKDTANIISAEDSAQAQSLLEQFHTIAQALRASSSQQQAEAALADTNNTPEAAQVAFIKALAREQDRDAADVLQALYTLSPYKESRKEARRSLIRLEEARIYPAWSLPSTPQAAFIPVNPPRFWKGLVTEMREQGEVQLILCWEQGMEYGEAQMLSFLLDFWREGVKDFTIETGSRRRIDARVANLTSKLEDVRMTDTTLAEGRRLLEEALSVNRWRGTTPHEDYRHHLPTVRQLILDAADLGEDRGRTFIDPRLTPEEVVINALGGWSLGDYGLVYDMLTTGSSLREGLARDEWIERRRAWADEANPARLELSFSHEREAAQSALWLPTPALGSRSLGRKEVEVGWSLELNDTPLSGTLKEMPMGTAVNKDTRRHWFWTSYVVVQEQNAWRIQSMTDEGANAQGLPIAELQKRIKEQDDRVMEMMREQQNPANLLQRPDPRATVEEVLQRMTHAMHYDDALIVKLSLDPSIYEEAYNHAMSLRLLERAAVYLEKAARRFPDTRADLLRQLGTTQATIAEDFTERGLHEQSDRFFSLAEKAFRESISLDNKPLGYILLAQMKIRNGRQLEEAEELLHDAQALNPSPPEQTIIEAGLGDTALNREQPAEALKHYQRAAEIRADYPGIWDAIAYAQQALGNTAEAEASFLRAIEENPGDVQAYGQLTALYVDAKQYAQARELLEQAIRLHPDSAHLRALLASVYLESGDYRQAQRYIEEAERINPQLESVQAIRQVLNQAKKRS